MTKGASTATCQICKQEKRLSEVRPAELVRVPVVEIIRKEHPEWSPQGFICHEDLNRFRTKYVERVLESEKGELTDLEHEVLESMREQELLARNVDAEYEKQLTFGDRLADKIAEFGGSWRFILIFAAVIAVWLAINSLLIFSRPFDPYPYILPNLVLSCVAALQAPVIMMSQNRAAKKDRRRAENDYLVNLKAELEIRHLNARMDLLLTHQWQRLLEIQEVQIDLMGEIVGGKPPRGSGKS